MVLARDGKKRRDGRAFSILTGGAGGLTLISLMPGTQEGKTLSDGFLVSPPGSRVKLVSLLTSSAANATEMKCSDSECLAPGSELSCELLHQETSRGREIRSSASWDPRHK